MRAFGSAHHVRPCVYREESKESEKGAAQAAPARLVAHIVRFVAEEVDAHHTEEVEEQQHQQQDVDQPTEDDVQQGSRQDLHQPMFCFRESKNARVWTATFLSVDLFELYLQTPEEGDESQDPHRPQCAQNSHRLTRVTRRRFQTELPKEHLS